MFFPINAIKIRYCFPGEDHKAQEVAIIDT